MLWYFFCYLHTWGHFYWLINDNFVLKVRWRSSRSGKWQKLLCFHHVSMVLIKSTLHLSIHLKMYPTPFHFTFHMHFHCFEFHKFLLLKPLTNANFILLKNGKIYTITASNCQKKALKSHILNPVEAFCLQESFVLSSHMHVWRCFFS